MAPDYSCRSSTGMTMNDFTRCPGCRLIRPEGEGLCPSCSGTSEPDPRREGIYIPPVGGQLGRTIYGDFGPEAEPFLKNPDPEPEPFRPAAPYRPDRLRGEGPAQACLEMTDAGPLFAGCPEVAR